MGKLDRNLREIGQKTAHFRQITGIGLSATLAEYSAE